MNYETKWKAHCKAMIVVLWQYLPAVSRDWKCHLDKWNLSKEN